MDVPAELRRCRFGVLLGPRADVLGDCGASLPKPPTLVRPVDLSHVEGLRAVLQGRLEELCSYSAA
mgnify:CR=1 FL=1